MAEKLSDTNAREETAAHSAAIERARAEKRSRNRPQRADDWTPTSAIHRYLPEPFRSQIRDAIRAAQDAQRDRELDANLSPSEARTEARTEAQTGGPSGPESEAP